MHTTACATPTVHEVDGSFYALLNARGQQVGSFAAHDEETGRGFVHTASGVIPFAGDRRSFTDLVFIEAARQDLPVD